MEIDSRLYPETQPRRELPPATINLLCGLAHETKAILYALMRPSVDYDMGVLRQSCANAGIPFHRSWEDFVEKSFKPYGLVQADENTGYFTVGSNYEQALALTGKLLMFSWKHPQFLLSEIFGEPKGDRNNAEKLSSKSPAVRFSIINAVVHLSQNGNSPSEAEISAATNLDRNLVKLHLQSLDKLDLIVFHSKGENWKRFINVRPKNGPIPDQIAGEFKRSQKLAGQVIIILNQDPNRFLSLEAIYEQIEITGRGGSVSTHNISRVVSMLRKKGWLEDAEFSEKRRSKVKTDPSQMNILQQIALIVEGSISPTQEYLAEGASDAAEVINDPVKTSGLLEKVYNSSSHIKTERNRIRKVIEKVILQMPPEALVSAGNIRNYLENSEFMASLDLKQLRITLSGLNSRLAWMTLHKQVAKETVKEGSNKGMVTYKSVL